MIELTVKELYQWGVENNCGNLPIRIGIHYDETTYVEPDVDCDHGYVDI